MMFGGCEDYRQFLFYRANMNLAGHPHLKSLSEFPLLMQKPFPYVPHIPPEFSAKKEGPEAMGMDSA